MERASVEWEKVKREMPETKRQELVSKPGLETAQSSKLVPQRGEACEEWVKERMQERWNLNEIRKAGESSDASSNGIQIKSPAEMARPGNRGPEHWRDD